jgi:hypothetical protein
MNKYSDHGCIVSQLLDCGVDKSLMSRQDFADIMIKHRLEGICSVDYTMSSNSRMSSKLLGAMPR